MKCLFVQKVDCSTGTMLISSWLIYLYGVSLSRMDREDPRAAHHMKMAFDDK